MTIARRELNVKGRVMGQDNAVRPTLIGGNLFTRGVCYVQPTGLLTYLDSTDEVPDEDIDRINVRDCLKLAQVVAASLSRHLCRYSCCLSFMVFRKGWMSSDGCFACNVMYSFFEILNAGVYAVAILAGYLSLMLLLTKIAKTQ